MRSHHSHRKNIVGSSNVSPNPGSPARAYYDTTAQATNDATVELVAVTPVPPELDDDFDKVQMGRTGSSLHKNLSLRKYDPKNITALYMGQSSLAT